MQFQKSLIALRAKIKRTPRRYRITIVVFVVAVVTYGVVFLTPKSVNFSYGGDTCARQLLLFPTLHKATQNAPYFVQPSQPIKIGNVTIATLSLCFSPTKVPEVGKTKIEMAPFGGWFMQKTFDVIVPSPPTARLTVLDKPIPASRPLDIPLSSTDKTFSYIVRTKERQASCIPKEKALSCDIAALELAQGKPTNLTIDRVFGDKKIATIATKSVATLPAVHITDSSIKPGETVYTKPQAIDVVFDKKITTANFTLNKIDGATRTVIDTDSSIKERTGRLTIAKPLPRSTAYELVASNVEASDGSGLETATYILPFKMSGGPKVERINVGTTGVPLGATVAVTFDQSLSEKQDISKIVSVSGGAAVSGRSGAQLFISLAGVPKCGDFSIKITNDLQSNYDIGGNSAWSYAGRTVCHTIRTIGYSSQGRAINAYYFGSGPVNIVYTGAIHGSESSTKSLMERWISHLEVNARSIPANKTIVVVPQLNPDGIARRSRVNARNVDLNRNFATSDWKKDITTVENQPFPGGGGESPMSEPETRVIAALVQQLHPALVLSYHSIGGVVAANQAGNSSVWAGTYASYSGYRNVTGQSGGTFEYAISGTADDWYAEQLGVPSLLIELGSHTYHQFDRNQKAMWAMTQL